MLVNFVGNGTLLNHKLDLLMICVCLPPIYPIYKIILYIYYLAVFIIVDKVV